MPMADAGIDQDSYGVDYWQHMDGGAGPVDSTMWEDLAHIVKEMFFYSQPASEDVSAGKSVIDIGCGQGYLVRHLRRRGLETWGADFSEYALDQAPEDVRTYLRQYDLTGSNAMSLPGAPFDLITCFETMEHIPEHLVDLAIVNIFEGVKPGGRVLFAICTDDRDGAHRDPTHLTVKSRDWWEAKFRARGLEQDHWLENWSTSTFHLLKNHNGMFVVYRNGEQ